MVTVRECQPPKSGDGKTNDYHVKNREDNIEGKTSIDVSYWNALYGLLVVGACVLKHINLDTKGKLYHTPRLLV